MKSVNNLRNEIKRIKTKLIKKAKANGIYENFGQKERRILVDKYGSDFYTNPDMRRALMAFDNWCMNYTGD